jgi:hypothetical protein
LSDGAWAGQPTPCRWRGGHDQASEGARIDAPTNAPAAQRKTMNTIIYIVGLVVIIGFILSYFGFR